MQTKQQRARNPNNYDSKYRRNSNFMQPRTTLFSSFSLQLASTSETILENSDKREHDNEELSFTTEMETITTEIETSSTIPHLRSLKSELSMETTDEE